MSEHWHKVAVVTSEDRFQTAEEINDCFNGEDARVVSDESDNEVYIERSYDDVGYGWVEVATEVNGCDTGEEIHNTFHDHSVLDENDHRLVFDYTNDRHIIERYVEE